MRNLCGICTETTEPVVVQKVPETMHLWRSYMWAGCAPIQSGRHLSFVGSNGEQMIFSSEGSWRKSVQVMPSQQLARMRAAPKFQYSGIVSNNPEPPIEMMIMFSHVSNLVFKSKLFKQDGAEKSLSRGKNTINIFRRKRFGTFQGQPAWTWYFGVALVRVRRDRPSMTSEQI